MLFSVCVSISTLKYGRYQIIDIDESIRCSVYCRTLQLQPEVIRKLYNTTASCVIV